MKKALFLFLVLAAGVHAQEEPSSAPSPAPQAADEMDSSARLEELDAAQIKLATDAIRSSHAEASSLDETAMARATLRGLFEGLHPGVELTGGEQPKVQPSPFRSEILDGRVGYLRLGSLGTENLAQLDAAFGDLNGKKIDGVVLDLRATPDSQDFGMAAQFAERFVPRGTTMFMLSRPSGKKEESFVSSRDPAFEGVLVVLVDSANSGASEALAAALRRHARATVVGANTSGRAVEFAALDLGGGQQLRYATAEVRVPGLPPIYPHGVEPDLQVAQSAEEQEAVLDGELKKSVAGFVFENGRARMNEAALVAGKNPEIDAEATENENVLLDRPLQRAVDLVTAIKLFRKQDRLSSEQPAQQSAGRLDRGSR